jgi:hypothetical protein
MPSQPAAGLARPGPERARCRRRDGSGRVGREHWRVMMIIRTQHPVIRGASRWWFEVDPPPEGPSQVRYVDWPSESMPNAYVTWIVEDH